MQIEDTKWRLEDEVRENKGKQGSSFWSKIPFLGKFVGKKGNPPLSTESSPAVANKEDIGLMATDENKEQEILFEQSAG